VLSLRERGLSSLLSLNLLLKIGKAQGAIGEASGDSRVSEDGEKSRSSHLEGEDK
jgi:hypothetical protein